MATFTVPDLLRDPEFRKLPRDQQLLGLREVDAEFGGLPEEAQLAALDDPEFQPSSNLKHVEPPKSSVPGMERLGDLPRAGAMPARPEYNISGDKTDALTKAGLYVDETVGAVFRPLADMQANVGAAMETKGILPGVGKAIREQGEERAAYWAPRSEDALKALADNPEVLGNVDWWLNRGVETASQMVAFIAAGEAVGPAAGAVAGAAGTSAKVGAAAELGAGLLAMSGLEVLVDAGGAAKQVYEQTGNRELAAKVFDRTATYEAVPTVAGNLIGLKNPAVKSALSKVALSMLSEGAQEGAQGVSQRYAYNVTMEEAGRPERESLWRNVPEEALVGGLFGGGIGGVMEAAGDRAAARPQATEVQRGAAPALPEPTVERAPFQPSEEQAQELANYVATTETGYVSVLKTKKLLGSSLDDARGALDAMVDLGILKRTGNGQYKVAAQPAAAEAVPASPEVSQEPAPVENEKEEVPLAETAVEEIPAETVETVPPMDETAQASAETVEPEAQTKAPADETAKTVADTVQREAETVDPEPETVPLVDKTKTRSTIKARLQTIRDRRKNRLARKVEPTTPTTEVFPSPDSTQRESGELAAPLYSKGTLEQRGKAQRLQGLLTEVSEFRKRTESAEAENDFDKDVNLTAKRLTPDFSSGIRRLTLNRLTLEAHKRQHRADWDSEILQEDLQDHRERIQGAKTETVLRELLNLPVGPAVLEEWIRGRRDDATMELQRSETREGGSLLLPSEGKTLKDRIVAARERRRARQAEPVKPAAAQIEQPKPQSEEPVESEIESFATKHYVIGKNEAIVTKRGDGYHVAVVSASKTWGGTIGVPGLSSGPFQSAKEAQLASLSHLLGRHIIETFGRGDRGDSTKASVAIASQVLKRQRELLGDKAAPDVMQQYRELLAFARDIGGLSRWRDTSDAKLDAVVDQAKADIINGNAADLFKRMPMLQVAAEAFGATTPAKLTKLLISEPGKADKTKVKAGGKSGAQKPTGTSELAATNAAGNKDPEALEGAPAGDVPAVGEPGSATQDGSAGSRPVRGTDDRSLPQGDGLQQSEGDRPDGAGLAPGGDGSTDVDAKPRPRTTPVDLSKDYRITPEDRLGQGGEATKADDNIAALEVLKTLREEGREATAEEKRKLVRYVGWGGLAQKIFGYDYRASYDERTAWAERRRKVADLLSPEEYQAAQRSTLNAHYTSETVVSAMWRAVQRLGLKDGLRVLEPASGTGNFFGLMPESMLDGSRRMAVEIDPVTAEIFKHLYPGSPIQNLPYQEAVIPSSYFDLVISNVPFADVRVVDPAFRRNRVVTQSVHDYFFAKAMEHVRPGGLVAFITSRYTMDKQDSRVREYLADRADLIGAWRLPNTAFRENARTEVDTDVLFLRKRAEGEERAGADWLQLAELKGLESPTWVNEYFVAHPEMVLGTMELTRGMHRANELTVKGPLTPELLEKAINALPENIIQPPKNPAAAPTNQFIPAAEFGDARDLRIGNITEKDGKFFTKEKTGFAELKIPKTQENRMRGLLAVRTAVREVFREQLASDDDVALQKAQRALGKTYDEFVAKFGPISSKENQKWISEDPDNPLLLALESKYDRKAGTVEKTAIFTKRTIARPRAAESAATAKEGMLITLAERGRLDIGRIAELVGRTQEQVIDDLVAEDLIFNNPDGGSWQVAEEYLSGDVRGKLRLAERIAKVDSKFERNVVALRAVQPVDLEPKDISARIGASWIPAEVYAEFLETVLDLPSGLVKITEIATLGEWSVDAGNFGKTVLATKKWGTSRIAADELMERLLNAKPIIVIDRDPDGRSWKNESETVLAQERADALNAEFERWLWSSRHADRLAKLYNEKFNNWVLRKYNGAHLTFPGMAKGFLRANDLDPHQKNAVWRVLNSGNTLLAHVVGAGKTFEMIAAGVELKRIGRARKPLYVVPNHMLEQWAGDWARLYPTSNVLVVGKDELGTGKREKALARIATGDWDAVIVAHSTFERIPVKPQTMTRHIDEEIDELMDLIRSSDDKITVKKAEKAKLRLEAKLKQALEASRRDEAGATFEELGIDWIFVDESHEYKNLAFRTKMNNIKGLGSPDGANKTADLLMKMRVVQEIQGGGGVVFASGTPISNSMAEMFLVMRYLMRDWLKEHNVYHFDQWASTFADIVTAQEINVAATYQSVQRLAKFRNLPELLTAFNQVADVMTARMLNLPRPKLKGGGVQIITSKMSKLQAAYQKTLIQRAEKLRMRSGPPQKGEDNILKIATDGRKASLDIRLIDGELPEYGGGKIAQAADKIHEIWKRTEADRLTQAVFIDFSAPKEDRFDAYNALKDRLKRLGVPEEEIAFIHDFDTDERKAELFADVNAGRVRVVMGSTPKMGAGTNIQQRLVALHHLDVAWRPSDVEQREGRILRPGNQNKEVEIFRYVTEGSFDGFMWQVLEAKAGFISKVLSGEIEVGRTVEDDDAVVLDYQQMKAIASGNPLIREQFVQRAIVRKLDAKASAERQERATSARKIEWNENYTRLDQQKIALIDRDIATLGSADTSKLRAEFFGVQYDDSTGNIKKAGEAVMANAVRMFTEGRSAIYEVGSVWGLPVRLRIARGKNGMALEAIEIGESQEVDGFSAKEIDFVDPQGLMQKVLNKVRGLSGDRSYYIRSIETRQAENEKLRASLAEEPPTMKQLAEAKKKLADITAHLETQSASQPGQAQGDVDAEASFLDLAYRARMGRMDEAGQTGAATLDFLTFGLSGWIGQRIQPLRELGKNARNVVPSADYYAQASWITRAGVLFASPAARDLLVIAHDQAMAKHGLPEDGNWDHFGGATMPPPVVRAVLRELALIAKGEGARFAGSEGARETADKLGSDLWRMARNGDAVALVFVNKNKPSDLRAHTARHESIHREQFALSKIVGGVRALRPGALRMTTAWRTARAKLIERGYEADDATMMLELPAHIGAGDWQQFGLSREQARDFLVTYIGRMQTQFGFTPVSLARLLHPTIREEVTRELRQSGNFKAGLEIRGPRREGAGAWSERSSAERSLFQRAGDRGSAAAGGQGSSRRKVRRTVSPGGITKGQIRKLRTQQRKLDWTDETYHAWLKKETKKTSTTDLGKDEATALLSKMALEAPAGLGPSAALGLVDVLESPSVVLARSAAGRKIYAEAEEQYFEQERLVDRYSRNYQNAVKDLSKEQKRRVMLFRFVRNLVQMQDGDIRRAADFLEQLGEDPTLAGNPEEILQSDAEREANRLLTIKVFEPTRKIGVAKGFLAEGQKYEDYLSFYSDDYFRRNPSSVVDAAAQLAQEAGMSIAQAMGILEKANAKNVEFGSFDYVRNQWTLPGMQDLDQIAEVYIKGFARKVTITNFLRVANKHLAQIADPSLRTYAKRYIDQYAGRPAPGTEMMDSAIQAIPWLRGKGITASQIAGWMTSIQYQAKIGYNLWTPLLNLTQTAINTLPKYGTMPTLKAGVRSIGVLGLGNLARKFGLPARQNPFIRDLVKLRESGVLDSLHGKFERPVLHGWMETASKAGTALFLSAEAFNRATAYFAGVEQARKAGLQGEELDLAGRRAVRITQFFSGRLDAPLFARTPHGRVLMQFKSFPLKQLEFMRSLRGREAVRFAIANVVLGGFGAFYIRQALNAVGPDWEVTEWINRFDESFSVAALLHAWKLGDQLGIKQVPGTDKLGESGWVDWTFRWIAGPSLMALFETVQDTARLTSGNIVADQWMKTLIRAWAPGGVQINRALKAVEKTEDPMERMEILLNLGEEDIRNRGERVAEELSTLRKELERERRKLRQELRQ